MPFFIPVILIGVGVATGGGGAVLGGKGAHDLKRSKDRHKEASREYELRRAQTEDARAATNAALAALGEQQGRALVEVVVRMGDFLRRHERQVRESERLLVDGVDVTVTEIPGLRSLDVDAAAWIGGVLGSAVAGAGAGTGVVAAAGSFGVASTGAAISGLSGAAAESALLAFLGGGSLASGGGGMALGAAALNFVTIGPGLLVGGLVLKGQGTKAITRAREFEARIALEVATLDATDAHLKGVDARAAELRGLLTDLTSRALQALELLESEPFDPPRHAARFQRAMALVMAVRDVAATPIVDAEGMVEERSANLTIRYRPLIEETQDG
ncbi:hypothetical protein [Streptomyces resistomycificus]|uniref:Uncharacterized protein n=1 Tax=Streptomyces resistomycificus TaxID=67356 RepID=A0A0L8L8Q3_9ACTN|nr:hypothetical protein [Streptomyces resistomycificus]KOG34505.1 hypothetical protein ADK37_18415 [Streptomyces resistomycificus]KUO00714.1 hypothetical protein AQJ84_06865 [Streptomyces resistomycificus]